LNLKTSNGRAELTSLNTQGKFTGAVERRIRMRQGADSTNILLGMTRRRKTYTLVRRDRIIPPSWYASVAVSLDIWLTGVSTILTSIMFKILTRLTNNKIDSLRLA